MKKDLEKKLEAIVKERYPEIETLESRTATRWIFTKSASGD